MRPEGPGGGLNVQNMDRRPGRRLAMPTDIFDVLAVSLKEDSYSSLLVHSLRRHRAVLETVFRRLTGQALTDDAPQIVFRAALPNTETKEQPDIRIDAHTSAGVWRILIENKLLSGEGYRQCDRYGNACRQAKAKGEIAGFTLVYLTLDRRSPDAEGWQEWSHSQWIGMIAEAGATESVERDPIIGDAWRAYSERTRRYDESLASRVSSCEKVVPWLEADWEGFITTDERCRKLAKALVPASWESDGSFFTRQGRSQCLAHFWMDSWMTAHYVEGQLLENCVSVQVQVDIPSPYRNDQVTCHLHFESNPYMTQAEIKKLGNGARRFLAAAERFRELLHGELDAIDWRPANRWLQKAKLVLPLTQSTSVGEFAEALHPQLNVIGPRVSKVMNQTAEELGLTWQVP